MRCLIVGLGVQGKKRLRHAQDAVVATVDPFDPTASYLRVDHVPLDLYDAALVCTPDQAKMEILSYLVHCGKHVLVEKPLLGHNTALTELARLATRAGTACYTAYNHRFEPQIQRLKQVIDGRSLGETYFVRMFYGNGTAQDVRRSLWRDQGWGVRSDLGSHLLDLLLFLWGKPARRLVSWGDESFETRAPDYSLFGVAGKPRWELAVSLVSWRNSFQIDVIGSRGSAHLDGLCKWGPSTLTVRRRVFPSGLPGEETWTERGADSTWAAEFAHFEGLCRSGGSNLENDIWINSTLQELALLSDGKKAA